MFTYSQTFSKEIYKNSFEKRLLEPYIKSYLFSLYNGFPSNHTFGFDTIEKNVVPKFKIFKDSLNNTEDLMADSGGYSIISGEIHSRDIRKFTECYNYFLSEYNELFDYIFSLDIPILLNEPDKNTCRYIYAYNYLSCKTSKAILDLKKELYDKFIFVWQWKTLKQFEIWNRIYSEFFENEKELKHFAIGGLVSLRSIANLSFAPFIAMSYKILKIIKDKNLDSLSILHILGQYGRCERFIMIFFDELINKFYLKDNFCKVNIRYDTINYALSGYFKVRDIPFIKRLDLNKDFKMEVQKFIPDIEVLEEILIDFKLIDLGKPLSNTILFALTNIIHEYLIDMEMQKFIQEEKFLEFFLNSKNYNILKNNLPRILNKGLQKYPFAFNGIINDIIQSFEFIFSFHKVFLEDCDMKRLDNGIKLFITKAIKFPFELGGNL